MRKWFAGLAALLLVAGFSVQVSAGPGNSGEVRISMAREGAVRAGLAIRHELAKGRVSADVNGAQLAALQRQGIAYDLVPVRTVDATAQAGKGRPGTGRTQPTSQVPYGVKMVYGNPSLTPGGIGGGEGIVVAVLDTGSVNHSDFTRADGSKVITGCVDLSQKKVDQVEGSCTDGHGHGTHVTGTIAAAGGQDGLGIWGVAPGASILSYKVLDNRGRGYADDVARGIMLAADRGANIISMSLGSSSASPDELDAIRYANSKGVLVIVAAGNSGPDANTISYPGAFAEAVAVAALNADETVAYFSSRGITDGDDSSIVDREVEVAGPGRNTLSTYKDGAYATMSGTSMATPHMAGLAAKMWQGSASATRSWLVSQAQQHDILHAEQIDNAGPGYDIAAGYGLPQVTPMSQPAWNN